MRSCRWWSGRRGGPGGGAPRLPSGPGARARKSRGGWLAAVLPASLLAAGCGGGAPAPASIRGAPATVVRALVVNDSLGVEDRCTACHQGVLDPGRKLASQPLTAHPGSLLDLHPPRRFGCTPCHGGRGAATTAHGAHAGGASARGFLTRAAVEIACGKCHVNETELDGAPHLSRGRHLIRQYQCDGCHQIGEFARSIRVAPNLAGIASRTNPSWLFRWLKNPREYAANARMPHYLLGDRYLDALVGYLMTFRQEANFDTAGFPPGDAAAGQNLVRLSFCITCHTIDGRGGKDAIDLGRVGNKLSRAWLLRLLSDTHRADPGTPMPQYRFTRGQVADMAAYLREELADPTFDTVEADSALAKVGTWWPSETRRIEVGRRLFKELRCGNCHAFPGGEGWIRVGPLLARLGEKKLSDVTWAQVRVPHTLADYVWRKVQSPRAFETTPHQLKMPTYDLGADEARDVAIALLAQADVPLLPDAFVVRDRSSDTLALSGEFGRLVQRYRCLSCHSVNGIGHNISYDLGVEGSRVRRDWLFQYLKLPYTIRPILTVRMPVFNLTDEEARVLADGITAMRRDAEIDSMGNFPRGPREVEAGKRLFERSGCMSCHQVGPKGGYVGPSFTTGAPVGRRLEPGWIVAWLLNPQALKPDVLEPRYGFTREQAQALAAYLMTLSEPKRGDAP